MKRLRWLFILLLTACASPSQLPEEVLESQAPRGEFTPRTNLINQHVTLQGKTVLSPNRIILDRNAFTGRVQLSLEQRDGTPLPTGITARFSPNNTSVSASTLIISVAPQVTPKTYTFRIKGVSGSLIKYASFNFIVAAPSNVWTACVTNTFPECDFEGLHEVRFGADGKYVSKLFFDYVGCNSIFFDDVDPAPGVGKTCWYGPIKTKRIINPNPANGLGSALVIPLGNPGSTELRVRATDQNPYSSGDGKGAFRVYCDYSHMAFDDPIIYPGQPGASHLHTFFGNTRTSAATTPETLRASGNSTCHGGIANRSSYWIPTLLDANNQPQIPAAALIYYKTGFAAPSSIKQIPAGLRMIAGNAGSSLKQENIIWGCFENDVPNTGFIPSGNACGGAGKHVKLSIIFPQCWDGKNLDSLNHKSHMAYGIPGQGCPASHPVALPEITINVRYKIPLEGATGWRLSSDTYSKSLAGGFSLHGDFMNGWRSEIAAMWIKNCDNAALDCNADLLGEGKTLY